MTVYLFGWSHDDSHPTGQRTLTAATAEQADQVLNHIAADGGVYLVDVYQRPDTRPDLQAIPPYGFQIVWGHPHRAAMTWLGDHAADALDPCLPPWPEPIDYDHGQATPRHTRITPAQVRTAVAQYIHTGQRPTSSWTWQEAGLQ